MNENSPIKEKILDKITKGQVEMRPRAYFVLKMIFFVVVAIFAFFLSLFVASFIIFILKTNGNLFLFRLGQSGLRMFVVSFPWLLGLLFILLIIFLGTLTKEHKFSYRKPFLYSVLGIVAIILIMSSLFAQTSFHNNLFDRAKRGGLPMMGQVYLKYGKGSVRGLYIGTILNYSSEGFSIKTNCGHNFSVKINKDTKIYKNVGIDTGSSVIVTGKEIENIIYAKVIKVIKPEIALRQKCQPNK